MDDTLSSKAQSNYARNGKIMLCSVVIVFVLAFIIVCFRSHALPCFFQSRPHRRRRRRRPIRRTHDLYSSSATTLTNASSQGLDLSVIECIPTFFYSATGHPPMECPTCLSEFEHNERARILPKCQHAFHVECIDKWFGSHSSCPLCRAPVQTDIPLSPPKIQDEIVIPVAEPTAPEAHREEAEENLSSQTPLDCQLKTLEQVGILVQVPNGVGSRTGSLGGNGSMSPSKRIVSLRRICSI